MIEELFKAVIMHVITSTNLSHGCSITLNIKLTINYSNILQNVWFSNKFKIVILCKLMWQSTSRGNSNSASCLAASHHLVIDYFLYFILFDSLLKSSGQTKEREDRQRPTLKASRTRRHADVHSAVLIHAKYPEYILRFLSHCYTHSYYHRS